MVEVLKRGSHRHLKVAQNNFQHIPRLRSTFNHKNYNFLACDWFKNVLFSTNSLAKSLSDSLLLDSLLLDSLLLDKL